jgi:orotidine-5'-phosphate decarboxylase
VHERQSQIVLGLDPDPSALWPVEPGSSPASELPAGAAMPGDPAEPATAASTARPASRAARAFAAHCKAVIDAVAPACVAVKPQLARFELLGADGWAALETVVEHAHAHGLLVIADGKRGDIDLTARAYAGALFDGLETPFGRLPGLRADLATVNPLMGVDALEPFVDHARSAGAGVFVLVRTSNPGAADIEDLRVDGGQAVWERIAAIVERLGAPGVGQSGLSDVGAVVGATVPAHLARARELMGSAVFLLPGVGAQGGRVEDLAPAFAPGRAGGLIAASRSIVGAYLAGGEGAGRSDPADAARAEAERLRETAWALSAD